MSIRDRLLSLKDEKYKAFCEKLIPTVNPDSILGVRTPVMRALAKEIKDTPEAKEFLKKLPHKYYEENNLHSFLIEKIKDFDECVFELERFLPYVDNWATCDVMSPKCFKKHPEELIEKIRKWIFSDKTYTIRFGIEMLMSFYLDENFKTEYLNWVSKIRSEEYYVNMMIAWYFATALAKQYESTVGFIEDKKLAVWTHNKTIQKAVESYRITDEQKTYLKSLKIK